MNFDKQIERILEEAKKKTDSAEIIALRRRGKVLFTANGGHPDLKQFDLSEVAIRVIRDGKMGSAHGSLNNDPTSIIGNALLSSRYGPKAEFDFAPREVGPGTDARIFDEECANLTPDWMSQECSRIRSYVLEREKNIQFNVQLDNEDRTVRYVNTNGRDASYRRTRLTTFIQHMFEGSKEGIEKMEISSKPFEFPESKLAELIWERRAMLKDAADSVNGPAQVLVLPTAAWSLVLRLTFGVDGSRVAKQLSPLSNKMGEQIFDSSITIKDAPDQDWSPWSVPFDDEGMPTRPRSIVEKGHLKGFIFSRKSAAQASTESTGNGFKRCMWGDGIEHSPAPYFANLVMEPGDTSIEKLVESMEDGIVVCDVIGFHSGNILAGHYSMGVGTGFSVKNGKPQGRVIDTMISGNIYQDFKRVKALSKEVDPTLIGSVPAILFEGLQVSGKD